MVGTRRDRFGGLVTLLVLQLAINAGVVASIVVRDVSAGIVATGPGQGEEIPGFPSSLGLAATVATLIPSIFVVVAVVALPHSRMSGAALLSPGCVAIDLLHGGVHVLPEPGRGAAGSGVQSPLPGVRECGDYARDARPGEVTTTQNYLLRVMVTKLKHRRRRV